MNKKFLRFVSRLLIVSVVSLSFPLQPAGAAMIGTDAAQAATASVDARTRIAAFLSRADVQNQMQQMGVNPVDARARVNALTDDEINQLAGKIDRLPAGGLDWLGVILVVFVILLITDILGLTKIFPFTKSMR